MNDLKKTAAAFFEACETGKGLQECQSWCHEDATFCCQSAMLAEVKTVAAYADWMQGLFTPVPDGRYELHALAVDEEHSSAVACATFHGTHTGPGGPVEPVGKKLSTEYAYLMRFEDGRIRHLTKVWNDGAALQQLGWC